MIGDAERSEGDVSWLEQALAEVSRLTVPAFAGETRADVCVSSAATRASGRRSSCASARRTSSVALIEARGCGFGASGRNGGWATSWFDELDYLVAQFGPAEGLRVADRSSWAGRRLSEFAAEHGINCCYRQRGGVWAAAALAQVGPWEPALALERMQPARVWTPHGSATAGRRRARTERLGRPHLRAAPHDRADREPHRPDGAAGGAGARDVVPGGRGLRRRPADGPLPSDEVPYLQTTVDGRIVVGHGGSSATAGRRPRRRRSRPLRPGRPTPLRAPARDAQRRADFRRWFPQLADVRIERAWGGVVDRAPGHLPFVGVLGDHENVLYGLGFTGNGVAPSALIGSILGRKALGIRDADTESPLAAGAPAYLPSEPVWTVGDMAVRAAVERAETAEESGRRLRAVDRRLRRLVLARMPAALEYRLRGRRRGVRSEQ